MPLEMYCGVEHTIVKSQMAERHRTLPRKSGDSSEYAGKI